MPNALVLYGGWPGHLPERFAALAEERLLQGFDVEITPHLEALESSSLAQRDVILRSGPKANLRQPKSAGSSRP